MKNTNAIDKIIKELSTRDYRAAWEKYPRSYKRYYNGMISRKPRGYIQFAYTLGADTEDALTVKKDYVAGKVTESEYKAYCLRYNLSTR